MRSVISGAITDTLLTVAEDNRMIVLGHQAARLALGFHLSTDIQFLHQSTGRLPVPCCTKKHGKHVK